MTEPLELAVLEENGIPTEDMLQGVLMSIESNNNISGDMLNKALSDWEKYYNIPDATDFYSLVCHLICKADSDNLFRLSKAFPEHVRIYVETQLLKDVPEDKLVELGGDNEK